MSNAFDNETRREMTRLITRATLHGVLCRNVVRWLLDIYLIAETSLHNEDEYESGGAISFAAASDKC